MSFLLTEPEGFEGFPLGVGEVTGQMTQQNSLETGDPQTLRRRDGSLEGSSLTEVLGGYHSQEGQGSGSLFSLL